MPFGGGPFIRQVVSDGRAGEPAGPGWPAPPSRRLRLRRLAEAHSARKLHARRLFAPLGTTYDRYSRLLSLGQDPRWRRFLVSRIEAGAGPPPPPPPPRNRAP